MVEPIYCLKPAWCGRHLAGLRPETGLTVRYGATAFKAVGCHLVWITKYRYKILRGEVAERARDLIRQICHAREVVIVRGSVSPDHIHMLVSAPAHMAPSK